MLSMFNNKQQHTPAATDAPMIKAVSSDSSCITLSLLVEVARTEPIALDVPIVGGDVVVASVVVFVVVDLTSVSVSVSVALVVVVVEEEVASDVCVSVVAVVVVATAVVAVVVVVVVNGTANFFAQTTHAPLYAVVHEVSLNVKSGLRKAHVSTLEAQSGSPGAHGVDFVIAPNKSTHV
jgi:hypothetical protein